MRALADPVRVSPPYGARTTARALATAVATGGWLIARLALGQPAPEQTPVDREASDRDPEADEETPITLGDLLDEVDDEVDPDRVEVDDLVDPERELAIPDVVVTGSRIEQSRAGSAVHVEVIRRDEIEQSGARDAAELLEERAGLQLVRSFRGTELWLRGMDPQYTLVLVDGDRVPGQIGGAIDLSRYGVENIERVELVRGPSSALYGSDAIGGVVNLITRDVDRDFEAEAVAAYGLNNVVDAMGRVAGRPDPHVQLRLDGGFHYADAFRRGATDGATSGSSRMQWSLGGRADWNPSASQRFRVQGDYLQLTLQGVDEGAGSALFERTQVQEQLRVSVEHTLRGPQGLSLLTRVSYNQFREQYLNDQIGSQQLDDYQDNREQMGQLTTLVHYDLVGLGTHGLTAGFEELFQLLSSERLSRAGERSRFAVFAQDEWVPWEEGDASLTIVPGLRYDVDSQFGDQMSPKLSVRFDPVSQLVLRAAYGRGFRAPSFQQLLLRFENPTVGYVVYGNPDLGAETSHGVDVGAEWRPIDELSFSASFFRNDVENLIATVTVEDPNASGTVFSYANLTSAWTMGLESAATIRIEDYVGVVLGYTLTETWDGENERHLEGRALHRLTAATRFAYEPWEISFVARAAVMLDRVYYQDLDGDGLEEEIYADPIAQVDLRLSKTFTRHLELFVGIDNLLDAGDAYTILRPFTVYGGARGRY